MGIVLAIVTFSVVVMFIILNLCCQSQVGHEARAGDGSGHRARKGLDPFVIETFPVFKYSEVAARAHQTHSGPLECAVCLSQFEDDDQLRLLPKCNHVFHVECLDPWLKGHSTCPLCRVDLVPKASDLDELDRIELGLASNGRGGEVNQGNNNNNVDCVRVDVEEGYMGKYRRWKSMGHVQVAEMVEGECWKRFTLMLPMKEMMKFGEVTNKFKRTKSCI